MKFLKIALGLMVSAGCLWLALRGVRFREVGDALGAANYLWLVPAVAAIVASIALRGVRWGVLFHPQRGLRFSSLFGALNVGYLVNDVLPMRLGEVVRAYVLSQREPVGTAHALSTVAVERVMDVVTALLFLAAVMPFVTLPQGVNGVAVVLVSVIAVGALGIMLLAGMQRERTHTLGQLVTRYLPSRPAERLHRLLDSFLDGFAAMGNGLVAAKVFALSAAIWGLAALALYFALFAFHLELSPAAPVFVLALVSLSFVVPASPGHIGVFHFAVVTALAAFDVAEDRARAYSFVAHLVAFVPPMLLGAAYLWRAGLSWGRLFAFRRAATSPAEAEEAVLPPTHR